MSSDPTPERRSLRRYRTGDTDLDAAVEELAAATGDVDNQDLLAELLVTTVRLGQEDVDRGELKLVNSALKELRHSFAVFAPYRGVRKATIFGSARICKGDPAYLAARAFGSAIAERGWMVITGAGPGIMAAGIEGAGADRSFGVNIQLPFESEANEFISDDPKLINFRYFFTRKVMFMKESHGYALLPGGFGTMDEAFELLTLMQTGKSPLAPVVLLDPPESTYWAYWTEFVEKELVEGGLISSADLSLVFATDDPVAAADHICDFYNTYHSMRYVGKRLVLRLKREIGDEELEQLNDQFADLLVEGSIERCEPSASEVADEDMVHLMRLSMHFDRHAHARLRQLIDALNRSGAAAST
ncbi:MAG: LOG family protein [Acidimicrobiia bacterium]|nr:LOG family protein [Actinomycetota bacterium]MBL6925008.1 LOG family protein [Acidimicrobiia bacterium]MBL6926975.1 LOG family protein [Acidimicrobiia bacterium]